MVHQHFMLIPVMTVAENIVLATEPTHSGVLLDYDLARRRVVDIAQTFKFAVDPDARIENISVGQQQRVEILKALYRGADILILDEPTAVLTPQEAEELFAILKNLKREGMTIIFISHKLNEVLRIADRITVLRRGEKVSTVPREGATEEGLAKLMVGRDVLLRVDKAPSSPAEPRSRSRTCTCSTTAAWKPCAASPSKCGAARSSGLAGVDGNGQTELIDAIAGLRKVASAERRVAGQGRHRRERRTCGLTRGLGHIPEDRQRRGLVLDFSLAENLALHDYDKPPASRFGWLYPRRIVAARAGSLPRISTSGAAARRRWPRHSRAATSRRWSSAARSPATRSVLIAAQPTRGLDVGAIEFVHRRLVEERDEGRAILLVSFELDEVLSLSDRILVIYEGRIVGEHGPDVTEEELGIEMTGGKRERTAA